MPSTQRDEDKCCTMLVIAPDGEVRLYQAGPYPMVQENRYCAIGSGKEAAAAVLELGFDAKKAVEIASRVCVGCGNGMDTLELEGD
jgi:20S proteasome alpha/beta subunit